MELRDGNQYTNHCVDAPLDGCCYERQDDESDGIVRDDNHALRDIAAGEELTENYGYYAGSVTPDWLAALMEKYCPGKCGHLGPRKKVPG